MCASVCLCSRADGVMRTMVPEKLLKSMPILQGQIDALLEFDVCFSAEMFLASLVFAFLLSQSGSPWDLQ